MGDSAEPLRVTMHETQGCLVVPIQEELSREAAQQIQKNLLEQIHARSVHGVVIDLSGVKIIDGVLWDIFTKTTQMIRLLGLPSIITGLNPGAVASIVDMNLDTDEIVTALNLEDALGMLSQPVDEEVIEEGDVEELEADNQFQTQTDLGEDVEVS